MCGERIRDQLGGRGGANRVHRHSMGDSVHLLKCEIKPSENAGSLLQISDESGGGVRIVDVYWWERGLCGVTFHTEGCSVGIRG